MKIYKTFDIVIVPFPFADKAGTKNRPAVVLSNHKDFNQDASHSILAMITSSLNEPWPLDVPINDLSGAGLSKSCVIRMKLFTIDNQLIRSQIGTLSAADKEQVMTSIMTAFKDLFSSH